MAPDAAFYKYIMAKLGVEIVEIHAQSFDPAEVGPKLELERLERPGHKYIGIYGPQKTDDHMTYVALFMDRETLRNILLDWRR